MRRLVLLAAAALVAAPAFAYDMPMRKAGLWDLKMEFVGSRLPAREMKQCTDASSDKLMTSNFGGSTQESCSKHEVSNRGGVITVDSVCKFGQATSTSHAMISGSFDSAYTVEVTSKREGGPPMPHIAPGGETHMKITAKWLGPCAAGQRPGDMIMGNGMTINILDLQKMGAGMHMPRR
jgi:Protein of unknown function (DUF3617)